MEAWEVQQRVGQFADDLEKAMKARAGGPAAAVIAIARALLDEAKKHTEDDPVVAAIEIPEDPDYSELVPLMRQLHQALPTPPIVFA